MQIREDVLLPWGGVSKKTLCNTKQMILLIPPTDNVLIWLLIVNVCPLLIIHAVFLSLSQKTRGVFLFHFWRGLGLFLSPCVLPVSQNLLQMESKISAPETDLFAFSSEVVTLTFSLAYVILPTPSLLVFSPDHFLIGPQELSTIWSDFLDLRGEKDLS